MAKTIPITLKGSTYRSTHRASVLAILGDQAPPVSSRGSRFYNKNRWSARFIVTLMCEWAKNNPNQIPTDDVILMWVQSTNNNYVHGKEIVIAATPDKLPQDVALALVGGGYHEAWHTAYSCLRNLTFEEIAALVKPRWSQITDWSKYAGMLLEWSNVIEDIRIERLGCKQFPGTRTKMAALQDFVLRQEEKSRLEAGKGSFSTMAALSCSFRDIGLGYNTTRQQAALGYYAKNHPEAFELVGAGPLRPLLDEAIRLNKKADLGSLRIAMDVVIELCKLAQGQGDSDAEDEGEDSGGEGQGQQGCPSCHAPAKMLEIRPIAGDPSKGLMVCTVCGFTDEIDLEGNPNSQPSSGKPQEGPKMVGFPEDNSDEDESDENNDGAGSDEKDESDDSDEKSEDGAGESEESDKESDEEGSEGAGGEDSEGEESEGTGDGSDEGEGSESAQGSEGSEGSGDDSSDESSNGSSESASGSDEPELGETGTSEGNEKDGEADNGKTQKSEKAPDAGGHNHDEGQVSGDRFQDVAQDALNDAENGEGSGCKDYTELLEQAISDADARENSDVEKDEKPWRPYRLDADKVATVKASRKGKATDERRANNLLKKLRKEIAFLRSRLRTLVRSMEITGTTHGMRRGRGLSERFLVDSRVSLMGGQIPSRAYYDPDATIDTSLSAAIVIDESGSMSGILDDATKVLMALTEPLDALGCPVQVSGFRNGKYVRMPYEEQDDAYSGKYHRQNGIIHDIFKKFDEPFRNVKWRFANTCATGGTPMADGVQFALDSLSSRNEAHRVMFVVTDGCPNHDHVPVMRRQLRLAKDAGIHVVGVGLGDGAVYVKTVFPDHVWSADMADLPKLLVKKLNDLLDIRANKRGRRVRKSA